MILLPAIDVRDGAAVRLFQGDYAQQTTYSDSPVDVAKSFADQGATWLHLVDLDGAKAGEPLHLDLLEQIVKQTNMSVEVGGGIRSRHHIQLALDRGATRVIMGTRLIQYPDSAAEHFGEFGDKVVAGIDTRGGMVSAHGWTEDSEMTGVELGKKLASLGCKRIIFTDIAKDGTLAGPALEATDEMIKQTGLKVIASGGISQIEDLIACRSIGCEGAITGKALYENVFSVREALQALEKRNP